MPEQAPSRSTSKRVVDPAPSAKGLRVAIVVSAYNSAVTDRLLEGAVAEFLRLGGRVKDLTVARAPGSFELPALAMTGARGRDAVVALGCIIRGETSHDRVIADAVANGIVEVSVRTGVPVAFGVLTCDTFEQAEARSQAVPADWADRVDQPGAHAKGKQTFDNKGVEAMGAAVRTALAARALRKPASTGRPRA